jgi:hypothetical protein
MISEEDRVSKNKMEENSLKVKGAMPPQKKIKPTTK